MAIAATLKSLLEERGVPYEVHPHRAAYTAQQVAAVMHVPGKEVVKVVIVDAAGRHVMLVMPAAWRVDLPRLAEVLGEPRVRLAAESELRRLFPDSEVGAMPPFGHLYGLPTYVDQSLTQDEEICIPAGTHFEAIRMKLADYLAVEKPRIAEFARHV